jgi:FkbH-like protein
MYESEINGQLEDLTGVPHAVVEMFTSFRSKVSSRTALSWGEHCTECVWPTCYTTCDLYSPRQDGKCRRFEDGMVRVDCPDSASSYLLKIRFKRWAKLWSPGSVKQHPLADADRRERRDQQIGKFLYQFPAPEAVRNFAIGKRYGWKKRVVAGEASDMDEFPTYFAVECYNPTSQVIPLSLTIRPSSEEKQHLPFERLVLVAPGFHRELVPVRDISRVVDLRSPFGIDITPNDIEDGTTLYFGLMDFITMKTEPEVAAAPSTASQPTGKALPSVKCIVWDLDNTMWDGVLVEDGPEKLVLKPGIAALIKDLDQRGILHSVASKNTFEDAMAVLKHHQLDEYFLYPQISWGPKSEAVKAIAKRLNIGIDTLLFVDDSEFELAEVKTGCPEVQTISSLRYLDLPKMPGLQVPVTEEGANRRLMYQQESLRETMAEKHGDNYLNFLRECQMEMRLEPLSEANLVRVHELTQRTNQMNFSGNRYNRAALEQVVQTGNLDTYVISCKDRFGSYGIVGFSMVDPKDPRMVDLMFSCRVQSKRVEHAFLMYLVNRYRQAGASDFWVNYRKTPKNTPSGRVFNDIGMEELQTVEGLSTLVFRATKAAESDGLVKIIDAIEPLPDGASRNR